MDHGRVVYHRVIWGYIITGNKLWVLREQPGAAAILHWVDPSTLEWLSLLVDQGPTTHLLALCTHRPDFSPPWTGRAHLTQVTLARLSQQQTIALTHQVVYGKALPI
jgi:hypothetical protein